MKRNQILFFKFFIFFNLNSQIIVNISIPKCGTHLLGKCINSLTGKKLYMYSYNLPDLSLINSLYETNFFVNHLKFNQLNLNRIDQLKDSKAFFIYRDPRDQLISFIFWGNKYKPNPSNELSSIDFSRISQLEETVTPGFVNYLTYEHLTFDELILQLIFGGSAYYDGVCPHVNKNKTKGIAEFYQSYMPWLQVKHICSIKFEDLIGQIGGGSQIKQYETLQKISAHIGLNKSKYELNQIASQLFGGTHTFREGKVGSWKKYFKSVHKKAFKQIAGQLLIDLGYERDFNW